jgi:hypothetical protein
MTNETPMTADERRRLLDAYRGAARKLAYPLMQTLNDEQLAQAVKDQDRLMAEYAERLTHARLSRCPICVTPLEYPIDVDGLDGPYWHIGDLAAYPPPDACEHFCVLLGAIDFGTRVPAEAAVNKEVLPGPGAPFVVPSILSLPGMKAVVYGFSMPFGDTAYAIAYFSEKPVHGADLHQPWGRRAYQVKNLQGDYEGWTASTAPWDFDLAPHFDSGNLLWIAPNDSTLTLHRGRPTPYDNASGVRAPQRIGGGGMVELLKPPTGVPIVPFE